MYDGFGYDPVIVRIQLFTSNPQQMDHHRDEIDDDEQAWAAAEAAADEAEAEALQHNRPTLCGFCGHVAETAELCLQHWRTQHSLDVLGFVAANSALIWRLAGGIFYFYVYCPGLFSLSHRRFLDNQQISHQNSTCTTACGW